MKLLQMKANSVFAMMFASRWPNSTNSDKRKTAKYRTA